MNDNPLSANAPSYKGVGRSERFSVTSASHIIRNTEDISWIVKDILPCQGALLMSGDPGVGKSWLLLDLAISVDQGKPWIGHFQTKKVNVLYVDEESAHHLQKFRLQKLLKGTDLPSDGSTLNVDFMTLQGLNISDNHDREDFEIILARYQPDLVILDSLIRVHRADENSSRDMSQVFSYMKRWTINYSCAFALSHHHRKPAKDVGSSYLTRGSTEHLAAVDTSLGLRKSGNSINVTVTKSRYGEVPPFRAMVSDMDPDGVSVRHTSEESTNPGKQRDEQARSIIKKVLSDGDWHSRQELLVAGEPERVSSHTIDEAKKRMITKKELECKKDGKQAMMRLVRPSDAPQPIETEDSLTERSPPEICRDDLLEI